nr:hypothetical protein [uncultured Cohaesibacter sp.]
MVNYVEQATLRVVDQSTRKIRAINKELGHLHRTASRLKRIKIQLSGIDSAAGKVRRLNSVIKSMPKQRSIRVNASLANPKGLNTALLKQRTAKVRVKLVGATAADKRLNNIARPRIATISTAQKGRKDSTKLAMVPNPSRFAPAGRTMGEAFVNQLTHSSAGAVIARGFLGAIGGELFQGVRQATIAAANAPLNREDAVQRFRASRPESTVDRDSQILNKQVSDVANKVPGVTKSELIGSSAEAAARIGDIQSREGQRKLNEYLTRVATTSVVFQAQGMSPAQAADNARILEGIVSQTGANPENAKKLIRASIQGIIASGGDLSAEDSKRTAQQLGDLRVNISDKTFLQALLARDESGARGTGGFRQFYTDLTRGNLNKEDKRAQIKQGLRDRNGVSLVEQKFREDFLGAINTEIIPRLKNLGVDLTNKAAVSAAIDNELGFVSQEGISIATDSVLNYQQRKAEFERAQQIRPEVYLNEPTVRQRGRQLDAEFSDAADKALSPLLPIINANLESFSKSLGALSGGEASVSDYVTAATSASIAGVGAGILALKDASGAERGLVLAGISLNSSAASLTGAASALSTAAAVQGAAAPKSLVSRAVGAVPVAVVAGAGLLAGDAIANGENSLVAKGLEKVGLFERSQTKIDRIRKGRAGKPQADPRQEQLNAVLGKLAIELKNNPNNTNEIAKLRERANSLAGPQAPVDGKTQPLLQLPDIAKKGFDDLKLKIVAAEGRRRNLINEMMKPQASASAEGRINQELSNTNRTLSLLYDQKSGAGDPMQQMITSSEIATENLKRAFDTGASQIGAAGIELGSNAMSQMVAAGDIIGERAAAKISAATPKVSINTSSPASSQGGINTVE